MRKILSLILVVLMVASVVACGNGGTPATTPTPNAPVSTPTPTSDATPTADNTDTPDPGSEYPWNPDNIREKTFILAHGLPAEAMTGQQYHQFAVAVEELSNGKMKIDEKVGGVLVTDMETLDAVREGTVDFIHSKGSFVSGTITDLSPITIAGYYGGDDWLGFVEELRPVLSDIYADYGIKYLGALNENCSVIVNSVRPITAPGDVAGMTFRASGTWLSKTVQAWGGAAVSIPLADLADSFNKGAIDGVMTGWNIIVPYKCYEVCKYVSTTTMAEGFAGLLMNMDSWNDLNEDEQMLIAEAGLVFQSKSLELANKFAADYLKEVQDSGRNEIIALSPEQEAEFIRIAFSLIPEVEEVEKLSPKGLELIRILKEVNGID